MAEAVESLADALGVPEAERERVTEGRVSLKVPVKLGSDTDFERVEPSVAEAEARDEGTSEVPVDPAALDVAVGDPTVVVTPTSLTVKVPMMVSLGLDVPLDIAKEEKVVGIAAPLLTVALAPLVLML